MGLAEIHFVLLYWVQSCLRQADDCPAKIVKATLTVSAGNME